MGNSLDSTLQTNDQRFAASVEGCYMSCDMVKKMIDRWCEHGKPTFMIPRDFKEKIITDSMESEIDLNYLRWLVQGIEIDVFEIMTVLTLYSRGSLHERLKILYRLYCFNQSNKLSVQEFDFMISKISTSVGTTLSIKKTYLQDIADVGKPKLIPDKEFIEEEEFITLMMGAFKEFNNRLTTFSKRVDIFNACVRKDRLPTYLMPGQCLLGKYMIDQVIPYKDIVDNNLREQSSVFENTSAKSPDSRLLKTQNESDVFLDLNQVHNPS